jgi:arylsulfatase
VLLVIAVAGGGCGPAEPPPSVIVVVIDTLRADHLGVYGYEANPTSPHLDARATSAAVFERAFSTAPWTLPSFGSLLTGQIPARHSAGLVVQDFRQAIATTDPRELISHADKRFYQLDESLPTLGTTLQANGYRTAAILNNAFLSPEFGLDRGFDSYDYDPAEPDRGARVATDRALQWLDEQWQGGSEEPFFLLLHYFDPHMPYVAPAPFFGRFAAEHADEEYSIPLQDIRRMRYRIRDREGDWRRYMALEQGLYDEEIAYTDSELERLLAALDERDFLADNYLLLTSDHGEEFHEHGGSEHGRTLYQEALHVPLLMWGPGVQPGRYELPVSLADIMPTLLDIVQVTPPESFEGTSLWQALREGPATRTASAVRFDRPLVAEGILYGDEKKTLIEWPWKILVDIEDEAELLYNLELDPAELDGREQDELSVESQDRLLTMLATLQAKLAEADSYAPGKNATLSEETLQRLRALGYIR